MPGRLPTRSLITRLVISPVLVAVAVLTGCTDDSPAAESTIATADATTTASTSAPGTTAVSTTTTTTLPPTTTSSTSTTTIPPTTTTAPLTAADLVLRNDGIGPLTFGLGAAATLDVLGALLGPIQGDATMSYPLAAADGTFTDDTGELQFEFPVGRTACFANGLCTQFGGPDAAALQFVGWTYGGAADPAAAAPELVNANGIGVGSLWADHLDTMEVFPGGCYTYGNGLADGIRLDLLSTGTWFLVLDDAGNGTPTLPDPADVTVVFMSVGALEVFLALDC
jgi:hypothetical protein